MADEARMPMQDGPVRRPDDRLSTHQAAEQYNIKKSTLRGWRRLRMGDSRYPRFRKLFTGKVYYLRSEFEADLKAMEVAVGGKEI